MPNSIKYNTGSETFALNKGNFWIGIGDVDKGPTSSTGFYNGITPPSGGYTIYLNKASGGPSIYCPVNDTQLISIANQISPTLNYMSNGGNFSDGTFSPFVYEYSDGGGTTQIVDISNDRPYVGSNDTKALELNYNGGRVMVTDGLLTVGKTYTFSFWVKITSGSYFRVSWNNQNGSGETNYWSNRMSFTTSWQRYSQIFTYNAARLYFYFYSRYDISPNDGKAIFTGFQLTETSPPAGPGLTTAEEAINWFRSQTDKLCVNFNYEGIVTDGLVLNLDAGFRPSMSTLPTNTVGNNYDAYYPIWNDLSGNAYNGTLINGPTFNSSNSGSIVFDGTDDYIPIPFNNTLVTNTVTVNMWCYANTLNVYRTPFTSEPVLGEGLNGYGFRQRTDNTWWWVIGYEGNGAVVSTTLDQNQWVNLIGTYDGTTLNLYKNGSSVGSANGGGRTVNFTSQSINGYIRIGSLTSGNDFFSGKIGSIKYI